VSRLERGRPAAPFQILAEADVAEIQRLRAVYPDDRSAILPALWILYDREGIVTTPGMEELARAMDLPPAMIQAVASFYTMFLFKPHGRYVVEMCTNLPCLLCGAGEVMRRFEERLGIRPGQTTPDDLVTLLEVECIGACGGAPAAQINHTFFENLTKDEVDRLVEDMRAARLDLHRLATGKLQAQDQELVDLNLPGAYHLPLPRDGAAGPVVDMVKGANASINEADKPSQDRGRR
jgi:NADH-quinone oxidoreductase E subunit